MSRPILLKANILSSQLLDPAEISREKQTASSLLRLLKTELFCKMSRMAMSASYGRTYLANFTACKGSFKSDKQLINAGLIILSLGFFADSE